MENRIEYQLTPHEASVIDGMRRIEAERQHKIAKKIEIMRVAYEAYKWSMKEGLGLTYSTFCDDFGYETTEYLREDIYDCMIAIFRLLDERLG